MSDFDREAERERLREKYEQDKKEREATERMSELLLQGATMTNAHCSTCGDPIFRYDGQEFCATCERPVDRGDGAAAAEGGEGGDEEASDDASDVEVTAPSEDTRVVFGGDEEETAEQDDDTQRNQRESHDRPQERTERRDRRRQTDPEAHDESVTRPGESAGRRDQPAPNPGQAGEHRVDGEGGVEAARASLVRTLAAFSQRAEATEDPQRAREHLQAAREAAEALAALHPLLTLD